MIVCVEFDVRTVFRTFSKHATNNRGHDFYDKRIFVNKIRLINQLCNAIIINECAYR